MKTIDSHFLLENLQADVRTIITKAGRLQADYDILTEQPSLGKWSVAQVLEHLNMYARYYITAIESKLHFHNTTPDATFKPGPLGNYFTKLMQPDSNNKVKKKMKAHRLALPALQPDAKAMMEEFIEHQHHLLNLLQIAASANLGTIRIPTFLSKFINLKLGDMFRFLIAHQQRHFVQIEDIIKEVREIPLKKP